MQPDTLAAVSLEGEGTAVAKIRRASDMPPTLEFCGFHQGKEADAGRSGLDKLVKEARIDNTLCISLVELADYSLLMVEAPDVQPEEMRAAIRWRIKDLIDFNIDDAVIDVFEVPETKSGGRAAMVYAVVARAADVKKRIDLLQDAGLNLEIIDIPELALKNIAAMLPEDVGGVAMVYIGQDNGLITITRQQTLYLSRRLASGLGALPTTLMHSNDPDLIEDWLDTIIVEIQRSLDYYESHFAMPQIASLVITPLSQELPGVAEYVSEQLDIPTRILDVQNLIDSELQLDTKMQSQCLLAIGAALRAEDAQA